MWRSQEDKKCPTENAWPNHAKMSSISDLQRPTTQKALNAMIQETTNENASGVHRIF